MKLSFLLVTVLLAANSLLAQNEPTSPEPSPSPKQKKLEDAYVRIINASTVNLSEPWRSGVDLYFKDKALAVDMRGGEASGYSKIRFEGKDKVEVKKTGESRIIASAPATFEAGGFYSIYVTGTINSKTFSLTPYVIRDIPTAPGKTRKGFAHIVLFNAASSFPVEISVNNGRPSKLPVLKETDYYLKSGSHNYNLTFPYKKTKAEMLGKFILQSDSEYTALIFPSPEKPDRPVLRLLNNSEQVKDVYEQEKAAEEEATKSKKQPVSPESKKADT
ncbi:MAG: DUF4397 domain-containing protein [Chthoniobacterales bacterium]